MKIIPILIITILLLSVSGLALSQEEALEIFEDPEIIEKYFEDLKDLFNNKLDQIPGFIKTIIGNERINIYINNENNINLHAILIDKEIQEIGKDHLDDPTLNIYVNSEILSSLITGELDIGEAINNKDITYQGVTFWNKIKYGLVNLFV